VTAVRETTSIKLDKEIKEEAKKIFAQLGISMGDAVNMFLAQTVFERGLPFDVKVPKELVVDSVEEVRRRVFASEKRIKENGGITESEYKVMMDQFFKEDLGIDR